MDLTLRRPISFCLCTAAMVPYARQHTIRELVMVHKGAYIGDPEMRKSLRHHNSLTIG